MELNPEKFSGISDKLRSEERYESGREELAGVMAALIGEGSYFGDCELKKKIESALVSFPAEERSNIILELQKITKETGWKTAHDILAGALDLDKEIERTVGQREQIEIYKQTVRRPENIQHFKDFLNPEGGPTHYWIPRKYDIQRYVKTAILAHQRSGRSGAIKILDIGGGSGFLGKLIADEASSQGILLEVTVMDPYTETVTKAKDTFSDTENLKFEIGTSNQALSMFGPELTDNERDKFDELEEKRLKILERGKEELSHIKVVLVSIEGESDDETVSPDISHVFSGAFKNRARDILEQSGVSLDKLSPPEQIRDMLADFYNTKWESHQQQLLSIRNQQEQIYSEKVVGEAKIDMVLNSWMPVGLDFTREMRMLNAPAIIYARERGGATGVDYPCKNPVNLGKETSYSEGERYDDVSWWEGVATSGVKNYKYGYSDDVANVSQIHIHKSVGLSDQELEIPSPPQNERYAWEESLEHLIASGHFY